MVSDKHQPESWPATTFEAPPRVRADDDLASRRALLQARGDCEAAVPPFITPQRLVLPAETPVLADGAGQALAPFDAEAGPIAEPFASIMLRTESVSSSEMENLNSSTKQVALAEIGQSKSDNARPVVATPRAVTEAIALSEQLDQAAIAHGQFESIPPVP